jgi:hypothetical protein
MNQQTNQVFVFCTVLTVSPNIIAMTKSHKLILSLLIATTPTTLAQGDCSRACESSGDNCNGDTIVGCNCGSRTCSDAVFLDAEVTCEKEAGSWSDACYDATFNQSSVQLVNSKCESCSLLFSQVTTDGPFSSFSSSQPVFAACSCCDDASASNSCPDGVPSCFINMEDVLCDSCEFWFSAVTTNYPFGTNSWDGPVFLFCSCCDDTSSQQYCPEGVPSCKANPKEFCAFQAHTQT